MTRMREVMAILAVSTLLTGCSTLQGVGTDENVRRATSLGRIGCTVLATEVPEYVPQAQQALTGAKGILSGSPTVEQLAIAFNGLPARTRGYATLVVMELSDELGAQGVIDPTSDAHQLASAFITGCEQALIANAS